MRLLGLARDDGDSVTTQHAFIIGSAAGIAARRCRSPGQKDGSLMPAGRPPDRFLDLLDSPVIGHIATVGPGGKPQVNPVWFLSDGEHVWLSVKAGTAKLRNLRANPFVALSIGDPAKPTRYVELRGHVSNLELFTTLDWVNVLARKYTGADFAGGTDGEERYKVTISVDSWTGQG
jgi:PPOX class probable F420-dependent enzyme